MSITLRAKRILTGALAGALVLGLLPAGVASAATTACQGAASGTFTDSNPTHQANIDCVAAYGVVTGFANGTFGGSQNITRGQMATFIARFAATTLNVDITDIEVASHTFTDVAGNVHADNIARIFGLGVTAGRTATTFAPNDTITRAEAATMLANAHVALGVNLAGVTPSTAFTDLGTSVHADNINILAGAGVVSGKTATTFAPSASILRAEAATLLVRSITVLRSQNLWDAPALGAPASANIVTAIAGGAPITGFSYSDGSEVVAVTVGATDVFKIGSFTVNLATFEADLSIGDEVVVQKNTPATGRQTITLTNRTAADYTAGVTGGLDGNNITIIEPVSGVDLRGGTDVTGDAVIDITASLSTYTVDGAAATLAQFQANINRGDHVSIAGAGTNASPYVFALTNRTVTGKATANAATNDDGDLVIQSTDGFSVPVPAIADGDVVTIDGVTQTGTGAAKKTAIDDHLGTLTRTGDIVTYARAAGVQTITITSMAIPAVSGVVGPAFDGLTGANGDQLEFVRATEAAAQESLRPLTDADYNFVVDGTTVSAAVFKTQLTVGDAVTVQERDDKVFTKGTITLTNQALSGKVRKGTAANTITVDLNTATVPVKTANIDTTNNAALFGSDTASTFTVNGTSRTQPQFAAQIDLIAEGTNTGTIVISRVGTATNYALTTTPAVAATFTVDNPGTAATTSVALSFDRPVHFTSALAAGDFVLKNGTTAVNVTAVSPLSPAAHSATLVLTTASFTPAGVVSVELSAQGAAKIRDKNNTAAAASAKTTTAVALALTTATPDTASEDTTDLSIALVGTGFTDGATVTFDDDDVTVKSVTVTSSTAITVVIDVLAGAAGSVGTVTVTNTNGAAVNTAFTVTG